ncbi:MAG TPA: ester cyclase [Candidatus Cybelea sp.]
MSENNKAVVRRLLDELWSKGNLSVADECYAAAYTHHDPSTPDFGPGAEGEKKRATLYRTAFPDLRFKIEDLIAEGETVAVRWSSSGTNKGNLGGIAPTGKRVTITGVSVVRFADGKIVEGWINWDTYGMLKELGLVPDAAAATL